ncbi:MarR family winged helix-turn-helix transcriptional regulator [Xenorhabdus cabanillasii]|uniref:MarR family transcriptional regulator n=2 Tax=Xenorhabdus cabanillasii TaxID=351673 RepID=A0A3D9UNK8_9GAMM|nr:MarR family transcriptional regulator [Xenorhabdus cabanillasii]PHM76080.1 MarR family transcriptional regulator [Xenorhabdus cabanillasii JM26]REF28225.1 MarR family transcriptional regulator [Xenorhabdus cabanillasii]CDL86070.1 Transcriptional regulator, MarR family [Xenorhabdus cabanillasii JM26]
METDNQNTHDAAITPFEEALSRLQCVLVARRTITNPEGVSWAQYDTLYLLRQYQPIKPSIIGEKLGFTRSKTSKILRSLKDKELIEQEAGESDKRELVTKLSQKGLMFLQRAESSNHNMADIVAANMSQGEIAIFTELCNRATDLLYAQTPI